MASEVYEHVVRRILIIVLHIMNITKFSQMPLDEKTNYLWDHGVCTTQRLVRNEYVVCIFRLEDFFVEARYSKHDNCVKDVKAIKELDLWEAYVDLQLTCLFSLS